ncbi:MAG TPA: glycosyltransferase family 2 protein [Terriglobales bacterium]|jgi:cellulose synthase/poly-beta-1,6-N-acetylglucosamine synthase-like glycosyltransferase
MPTRLFEFIFWASAFWCAYTYLLYPVLLWMASVLVQVRRDWRYSCRARERRIEALGADDCPSVSLIIPVHNEEAFLAAKLDNLFELDYPASRLETVFVADGCTDSSVALLRARGGPRIIELPRAQGKANALNVGVAAARNEVVVLCDAATLLAPDAVRKLVRHFHRPQVGLVCGTLQFEGSAESRATEGLYWRFECLLRVFEARLGATLTASGALYALRRSCYRPLATGELIDDFMIPMQTRAQGFSVVHDPEARATDFAADDIEGEFARRVRLAVGSFRALGRLLRIRVGGLTRWAFLSHKVGRWLVPFVLMAALASSAALAGQPLYRDLLLLQVCFYAWAGLGWALRRRVSHKLRSASFAYYLLAMNAAFVVGLAQIAFRHGETKWH